MRYFSCLMMVGLLPAWAPIGLARAQEAEAEKVMRIVLDNQPDLQTRLFSLHQVDIEDFVNTVRVVYNVRNVSAVERTNSVVVRSTAATLDEIAALLEQMKQQKPEEGVRQLIQVVPLIHRDAGEIAALLEELFGDTQFMSGHESTRIMPDHGSGQMVVKSHNAAEIAEILRTIKALDVSSTGPQQQQVKTLAVTVDFIRGTFGETGEGDLPESLQGVGAVLRKSGLGDLSVYGHLMVRTQEGEQFQSKGVVRSGAGTDAAAFINISGQAEVVADRAQLYIQSHLSIPITVQRGRDNTGEARAVLNYEDLDLNTTTTVPLGDYFVLGAMPTSTGYSDTILMVIRITAE